MSCFEIAEFCSDEANIRITFSSEVFWLLEESTDFFKFVKQTIWSWDCDIDKYEIGETVCYEGLAINITFDQHSMTFVVTN